MRKALLQNLLLLLAVARQAISFDQCRNFQEALKQFSVEFACSTIVAEVLPGLSCNSQFGSFCPLSCGMCDSFPPPECDADDIYEQKVALVELLHAFDICPECEAPLNWTVHEFVTNPAAPHNGILTTSWTSRWPGDPCNLTGVTCNRCGEPVVLNVGYPQGWPIRRHMGPELFRLTNLELVLMQGRSQDLPPPTDPAAHYIPAGYWRSLRNISTLLLFDVVTGDVPDLNEMPLLYFWGFTGNRLYGQADVLFGAPSTLGGVFEQEVALEKGPLSDRICVSPDIRFLETPGLNLEGTMPPCATFDSMQVLRLLGSSLTGPISQMLSSTDLKTVSMAGNSFTGTLPSILSMGEDLQAIDLSHNLISGTLPDLTNHTSLSSVALSGNRLTGAMRVAGSYTIVDLSDNLLEVFPESFMELPFVSSLDLSRNKIRFWPPAGVYHRGIFNGGVPMGCGFSPKLPAFRWPDMDGIFLSGNDLQGQDVRDILGSFATMPRLRVVEASDCNMSMNLPMEGTDKMLSQFNAQDCDLVIRDGFPSLSTLRLAGNRITSFDGGPWQSLQIMDISDNDLTYLHPLWFEDGSRLVSQNYKKNPMLLLPITVPPHSIGCQGATKLTMNPRTFLPPSRDVGYECTSLCSARGVSTLVDFTANTSILCRCRPGWYGYGIECVPCPQGTYCPGATPSPMTCAANSNTESEGAILETDCECDPGFYRIYNPPDPLECKPCPSNTYRPTSNARSVGECFPCALDTTSQAGTKGSCTDCPLGTVPRGSGQGCRICDPGTFADNSTKTCEPCPLGRFQPEQGALECQSCEGVGNTTWTYSSTLERYEPSVGSATGMDCGCESGRRPVGRSCVVCGVDENEGLQCAGGLSEDAVTVIPGYFSEKGPALSMYRCWGDEQRCAGGLPGQTCKDRRVGLTCALCEDGYVTKSNGGCTKCEGGSSARLIVGAICLVFGAILFYHVVDRHSRAKQNQTELVLSSLLSLAVTAMQQLGLLSQMSVEWTDPLKTFLRSFVFLNLNIEFIHVDCVSRMDPRTRFGIKVTMILSFCVLMLLVHLAFVLFRHGGRFQDRRSSLVCSLGGVVTLFYISVVVTISGPLQCQQHPNGKWTSRAYPSVICWDSSEHTEMVIGSILALLMPLGYLVHAAYTVRSYPSRVAMGDSSFLKAYDFYFVRFTVNCFWFILVQIVRNLILALSVMIPEGAVSIFTSLLVLLINGFLTGMSFPWRAREANHLDILLTSCVIVLFSGAFNFIPDTNNTNDDTISWICLATVAVVLAILPLICIFIIIRRFVFSTKPFAFFLCHHKAGAGAFTRLLKTWLIIKAANALKLGQESDVFLDSDNLAHLDRLFHHVRSETEVLVAIWSRELLLRPWCAGEVTIARLTKVRTLALIMPDHQPVTQQFKEAYQDSVNLGTIYEYGITLEMILESLSWLGEQPKVIMADAPCPKVMDDLVTFLRSRRKEQVRRSSQQLQLEYASGPLKEDAFCILADDANSEAIATGMVLEKYLIQLQSKASDAFMLPLGLAIPTSSKAVVFICSGGCLESVPYLSALAEAALNRFLATPVVAQETFRFPNPEQIAKLPVPPAKAPEGFHEYVLSLFKEIAVAFHAQHASEQVLRLATTTISQRLEGAVGGRGSSASASVRGKKEGSTSTVNIGAERTSTMTSASAETLGSRNGNKVVDKDSTALGRNTVDSKNNNALIEELPRWQLEC